MARQMTDNECRDALLKHIWDLTQYWGSTNEAVIAQPKTTKERLEGLAFSILSVLDGCAMPVPGFVVAPSPHKDDKEYRRNKCEDWWPDSTGLEPHDIGGSLHEHYHNVGRKMGAIE